MNIRQELERLDGNPAGLFFADVEVNPEKIRAVLINEIVPADPADDFYGNSDAAYLSTAIPLFAQAGASVQSMHELLERGIYLTNAVKRPKTETTVDREMIEESLPYLEKELSLFPNLEILLLMGDVAKKAFNLISKRATGKNVVPAVSTYKLRGSELYYDAPDRETAIRVFPSYIITGQNILIEKSKFAMASEDLAKMRALLAEK